MPSGRGQLSPEPSKRFKVSRTVEGATPRRRAISRVGIETENFRRIISRTWRIAILSAGIDRSLELAKDATLEVASEDARRPECPGGIIPFRWATSSRYDGRHHSVTVGGIISF